MSYNIKFLIILSLLVFVLLIPLNTRALPVCECMEDGDCAPSNYCDFTVRCAGEGGMCKPCECYNYGSGWHDAPFWGGCSDCNLNSQNWCGPCGEAKAYCDGCFWDKAWNPFRDEIYSGGGPGHKCPGSPPVCASGQTECRSGETLYECDSNRCGWHFVKDCDDSDGCYSYGNGCENRNYSCSAGACSYSFSNRYTDYYDSFINYCSGTTIRKHRLFHDGYCDSGTCKDHTSWSDDQFVEDCGNDYCEDWRICGCDGNYIKECRSCHSQGCNNGSCYDNPSTEERKTTNCNDSDGCVGTTYRDYSCSNGNCIYTDSACDSRCDSPPNIPTLIAPPNNAWIDYDPVFKARASDSENENVRVEFNIATYGTGWGNFINSGGTSEWGPVNLGNCTEYFWQARAYDACGFNSDWYGYWQVMVDKSTPISSINYTTGTIYQTTFRVNLEESVGCSGIKEGDIDVSINGGDWQHYLNTTDNFDYAGSVNNCYKFRYGVQNNAGIWSNRVEGEQVCIQPIPCDCSSSDGPCCSDNCNFDSSSTVCDTETEYQCSGTNCGADFQSKTRDRYCPGDAATCTGNPGSWSDWITEKDCTERQLCYPISPYCQDDSNCLPAAPPVPPPVFPPVTPPAPPVLPPTTPRLPAPTVTLFASPSAIDEGQSSTLSWSSTNTNECSAPWTTSKATSGSRTVSPSATTTYSITCTGSEGSASDSTDITVTVPSPPSPPPEGLVPCGRDFNKNGIIDENEKCRLCHIFVLTKNILDFILKYLTPVAGLIIIAGGIMILVGNSGFPPLIAKGKELIHFAVIGIIISLTAWLVINTIMVLLTNPGAFPWPWNKIIC